MIWNEADHPRDEIGRFTNKDGSTGLKAGISMSEEERQALFGDSIKNELRQKEKSEHINTLLNILGKYATHADILYPQIKKLEEKIKNLGLGEKLGKIQEGHEDNINNFKNSIQQKSIEFAIGKNYNLALHNLARNIAGDDTAGMLDLAHGMNMNDRSYINDVIHIKNCNDRILNSDKEYLRDKISKQFKDYDFDINKIKGYYFKSNSSVCEKLVMDENFRNILRKNKETILKNKNFSTQFAKNKNGINQESNYYNAFGKVDFRNLYFDKQGNLHIKMYDTYDFNKNERNPLIQAGVHEMEKGNLVPYFTIHDIIIPKNILKYEIWK